MKIKDIVEANNQSRITRIRPGQEAEIDHGDGTTTTVDLKQNPNALEKDPRTNRVNVRTNQNSKQNQNNRAAPKVGDRVEDDED